MLRSYSLEKYTFNKLNDFLLFEKSATGGINLKYYLTRHFINYLATINLLIIFVLQKQVQNAPKVAVR